MAIITDEAHYALIADAIRTKLGVDKTFTPGQMAPAILKISGGGTQTAIPLFITSPLIEGKKKIHAFTDAKLVAQPAIKDMIISENIEKIERIKDNWFDISFKEELVPTEHVSIQLMPGAYVYKTSVSNLCDVSVQSWKEQSLINLLEVQPSTYNPIPFMTEEILIAAYNGDRRDSGSWSIPTNWRNAIGYYAGQAVNTINNLTITADSRVTVGNCSIEVNGQDAGVFFVGHKSLAYNDGTVYKYKWRGVSHYNLWDNQQWELLLFDNGDAMLYIIHDGTNKSGTNNFNGYGFNNSVDNPYISFYRQDYPGTRWSISYELYDRAKHASSSDQLVLTMSLSNALSFPPHIFTSGGGDSGNYLTTLPAEFGWSFKGSSVTSIYCNGDSFIGIGTSNTEHVSVNRADAALSHGYLTLFSLSDYNNLKVARISWCGKSRYNYSQDQRWSLWLFENGDAMVNVEKKGSYNGKESNFLGITFPNVTGTIRSFYRTDTEGNTWNMRNGVYDPSYKPHERTLQELLDAVCVDISMKNGANKGTGGAAYNAVYLNGGKFINNTFEIDNQGTLEVPYKLTEAPWSFEIIIDKWHESANNPHGRFFRGNNDVPSIYYTQSVDGLQFKINATRAYANNVSWFDKDYIVYANNDQSASLLLPLKKDEKTHIVCRNTGIEIALFINGNKVVTAPTSEFTSSYQASRLSIGDDDNRGYDLAQLICSCFRIWSEALSNEEINMLYNESNRG